MTYEEVETRVERDLKEEKAKQQAREAAEGVRERLLSGSDMEAQAKEYGINVSDTGKVGRGEYMSGLGNLNDSQTQIVFSLQSGEISPVIETERSFVVFKLKEKTVVNEEEFAKQKDALKSQFLQVKQTELFNAWIERVKKDASIEIYKQDLIS